MLTPSRPEPPFDGLNRAAFRLALKIADRHRTILLAVACWALEAVLPALSRRYGRRNINALRFNVLNKDLNNEGVGPPIADIRDCSLATVTGCDRGCGDRSSPELSSSSSARRDREGPGFQGTKRRCCPPNSSRPISDWGLALGLSSRGAITASATCLPFAVRRRASFHSKLAMPAGARHHNRAIEA
jgi:hypothetical protein